MHICRGEKAIGDMHIPTGRKHHFKRKPCFIFFTLCLFSCCFMMVWFMFSIYTLLFSSHHAYVLNMYTSLCYWVLLVACLDNHLFCYMIIVVISIWLFLCLIKLLICFTICLLDRILLITLYLSFYHLIYLEGLMCFVQVFQVTSICSKFITCFRFRCEWVLSLFPNSRLSLKSVIRCFFIK